MTFKVSDPVADYQVEIGKLERNIASAATQATRAVAAKALAAGRASIAAAGFSAKFQNALRVHIYPEQGDALSPAAVISSKIPYADVFEDGAVINGRPYLWLPLSNVPIGDGGRPLSVSKFAETIGVPLRTISRPGKRPLLAAVVRVTAGRSAGLSLSLLRRGANIEVRDGKLRRGLGTVKLVPVYIGVPTVDIHKKFDVEGAVQRAVAAFDADFNASFTVTE